MSFPSSPLHFVTSNAQKAAEIETLLGRSVTRIDLDLPEIQSDSLSTILLAKLESAIAWTTPPVAVEDVSLELDDLGGFPGPYIKWLLRMAGGEGLGRIVSGLQSDLATARCLVAVWDGEGVVTGEGTVRGRVLAEPRGERSFGWDAWFVPEHSEQTWGEMSREEKLGLSHRSIAWAGIRDLLEAR
jgi:non-canonical purine NTP pyrophosphatase (RdgB/HAM1 family)